MVQSLNVAPKTTTFTEILGHFDGVKGNTDLRLKGETLYAHQKKGAFGHGLLTKRAEIMQRRNEATEFVIRAFKEEFSEHGGLVDNVLSHVMEDPSFKKFTDDTGQEHLQLRTQDLHRLNELMHEKIDFSRRGRELMETGYSGKLVALAIQNLQQDQIDRPAFSDFLNTFEEGVAVKAGQALLDENVKSIFDGGLQKFKNSILKHDEVILTPVFMQSEGMEKLRPLIGAVMALHCSRSEGDKSDFELALFHGTGSRPSETPPELGTIPGVRDYIVKRQNMNVGANWALDEIANHFFGEENPLDLDKGGLTELRAKLAGWDEEIGGLKESFMQDPDGNSMRLENLVNEKRKTLETLVDARITTMLGSRRPGDENPITQALESMTNVTAMGKAQELHDEMQALRNIIVQN